jgi:hypothetical protein
MKELQACDKEPHPFEHFKAVMRELATVSKAQLDAQLRKHNESKPKRRAGRKAKARKRA